MTMLNENRLLQEENGRFRRDSERQRGEGLAMTCTHTQTHSDTKRKGHDKSTQTAHKKHKRKLFPFCLLDSCFSSMNMNMKTMVHLSLLYLLLDFFIHT